MDTLRASYSGCLALRALVHRSVVSFAACATQQTSLTRNLLHARALDRRIAGPATACTLHCDTWVAIQCPRTYNWFISFGYVSMEATQQRRDQEKLQQERSSTSPACSAATAGVQRRDEMKQLSMSPTNACLRGHCVWLQMRRAARAGNPAQHFRLHSHTCTGGPLVTDAN